ncbi:B12-binding domain-containing radical SAM protein [Desulfocicer niacini]
MILIFPPVGKPCEPPAGVALLAGALKQNGFDCTAIDANIGGLLWLAGNGQSPPDDSWTRRAVSHLDDNLADLKTPALYANRDRYRQRVMDVNRVIQVRCAPRFKISLSDYGDERLSPVKIADLWTAARTFSDNPFYGYFREVLAPAIENNDDSFVGLSICYLSQALTGFALAGWIKARFPGKKIVVGGGLISSWMSAPSWKNPFYPLMDIMVRGRGEAAVVTLMKGKSIKGELISIQRVVPDFDFCNWDDYIAPGAIIPYRTATGCYWRKCKFCPETVEGASYQPQKNSDLLADLRQFQERVNPAHVHFLDDAVSPSFLKALAADPQPFTWYGFVRFTRELADPDFCQALYRSGCRMLKLGLESGDQNVLDKMNKGTRLETATRVLAALKKAGISTYVYLLFGTAFEDEAAADRTLNYVADNSGNISFLNLAIFNLPRFSPEVPMLDTRPFYDGDLSLYLSFNHPRGWNRRQIRFFLDRKFKKHPAIAPILRNDPPFFTSNHAMFLPSPLYANTKT